MRADDIATAGFCKFGWGRFVDNASLESFGVFDAPDGDNNVCRWFGLGVENLNSGPAKSNSSQQSQSYFVCDRYSNLPINRQIEIE